ncbi:MAG: HutD family protein [Proteobacteria bacterium]|nr:HutD family protein [Pseudomonadota bacterium]
MGAGLELLPAAARAEVPWKNGGGLTSEIAVQPPGASLADFDWRISCARVDTPAPFSSFPGIDRIIAVLEGALSLSVAGRPEVVLTPESAPWPFPGDVAASGGPVGGCVRDLNVMTRRGRCTARVQRCLVQGRAPYRFCAATTVVLASAALVMDAAGRTLPLGRLDAVRIEGPLQTEFSSTVPGACFYRIEIDPAA